MKSQEHYDGAREATPEEEHALEKMNKKAQAQSLKNTDKEDGPRFQWTSPDGLLFTFTTHEALRDFKKSYEKELHEQQKHSEKHADVS